VLVKVLLRIVSSFNFLLISKSVGMEFSIVAEAFARASDIRGERMS
jgi:hypothetical protein